MKTTYTKVDGKIFSIYTEKIIDIAELLHDVNIQHLECFFVTQREKANAMQIF